jgi:putative protein-disulfide isomerase
MKPKIIYCYDAYCGWCYGFSPVMKKIWENHRHEFDFETLSGGMIPVESAKHIENIAPYIRDAYKTVEETTGVKFGEDFLWHIFNPDQSDWFPSSEMPAIAMAIFREIHPDRTIEFAADLQFALHGEGRDLTDKEAYRHLLEQYSIDPKIFYEKLKDPLYKEKAHYDFMLVKQLKVNGFPTVFLQLEETKLYMVARGYSHLDDVASRISKILTENNNR